MDNKTKKTVAGLAAGAVGVASAGIVAGNIISDKQEKEISESSIVAEDNSNTDEQVLKAVTQLTGQTASNATITNNFMDADTECYEYMQDAIFHSFYSFNSEYSSLSDALVSTYGVELSDTQKARYDTVAKDTYEVYKEAIAAYESGDMKTFRKICDDVLNSKKYLNLDDLVDILSININLQGDYIKNSSNYSISDGKLIIDGITLESLFPEATGVDHFDVMSLISFYGKDGYSNNRVLDILNTPVFIIDQAIRPTNMTLVDSNTVYAYDNSKLKEFFDNVNNDYCSKLGLNHFGFEVNNGSREIFGYDENNNKHLIGNNDMYRSGLGFYLVMLDQYRKSENAKVGHFSGLTMKCFIYEFEKGIDNVNVPGMYEVFDNNEYENNSKIR